MAETAPVECRLILDPPAPGSWNMAVDEILLAWAAERRRCVGRFYRWQEATLSLGYFQALEEREKHAASRLCPVVRRPSGGGAIVHDRELTYSLAIPSEHPLSLRREVLYQAVHEALVDVLAEFGILASLHCGEKRSPPDGQAFLCFQRRAPGDVMVGDAKVAGSAQRRLRGAVLQHGSVLLGPSAAAPELAGLEPWVPSGFCAGQLVERWLPHLGQQLGFSWLREPLSDDERRQASLVEADKYRSEVWTRKRGKR